MPTREETIAAEAHAIGFVHAGCAALGPLARAPFMTAWLAEGRAGDMSYLPRRAAERLDPRHAFPWARSVVSLGYPYRPPPPQPGDWRERLVGRIAAYARGADYHDRVVELCDRLAARLVGRYPGTRFMSDVDTGPIVEREWAMRAGIGWIGKNTLVLERGAGSYFFLAELVTDLELDDDGFRARFGHTAIAHTKRRGLLRNVAVALGNSGNPDAVAPLVGALADREPLVRGPAAWALGRLGGPTARRALEGARCTEVDDGARDEIATALSAT